MLATVLLLSLFSLTISAESMGIMTENIPDTDIGGATGGAGEFVSEIASDIMPKPSSDLVPQGSTPIIPKNDPAAAQNADGTDADSRGSVFGVLIAIAVAVSLIMLILAFIPKNRGADEKYNDKTDRNRM